MASPAKRPMEWTWSRNMRTTTPLAVWPDSQTRNRPNQTCLANARSFTGMTPCTRPTRPISRVSLPTAACNLCPNTRTGKVERRSLERTIRTTAQLTADETKIAHIHVKVSGWIDKVYVDYVGQLVKKGQPLFTLYSPDLVATQEEYLIAKRGQASLGSSPFQEVSDGSNSLL